MEAPRIVKRTWGVLEVDGYPHFRDAKLYPGGARAWDWQETGTRHRPGVQRADVQEILDRGATTVVLSRGLQLQLQVPQDLVAWLESQGVTVHVLRSDLAVAKYNALVEAGASVGALVHSTC
jgi:hypothetical protein